MKDDSSDTVAHKSSFLCMLMDHMQSMMRMMMMHKSWALLQLKVSVLLYFSQSTYFHLTS